MKFQIGAMSVGDILDRTVKLFTSRLWTFFTINLIMLAPGLLFQIAQPMIKDYLNPRRGQQIEIGAGPILALALFFIAGILLTMVFTYIGTAATLHVIAEEFVDRRVGVSEAIKFASKRFWSILVASLQAGLIIALAFSLSVGGGLVFCLVVAATSGSPLLGILLGLMVMPASLIPGILFMVWYAFVTQVVVVEELPASQALARSKDLTGGYRWRVFGVGILLFAIFLFLVILAGVLGQYLPNEEKVPAEGGVRLVMNMRNYSINVVVQFLINTLLQSLSAICWTLFYFDLRIRKEGFDLEESAKALAGELG